MNNVAWSSRYLKVADEASYAIPLPEKFFEDIVNALMIGRKVKAFEVFISDQFVFSKRSMNAAIREVENDIEELDRLLERTYEWAKALYENKRQAISGAEYWELVSNWEAVKNIVDQNKKVILYPAFYASNMEDIKKQFDDYLFDEKFEAVMQPLYKGLQKCREDELALPKYQF